MKQTTTSRLRNVGAVVAGFLVTAVASVATDAIMHKTGTFPRSPGNMSDELFVLASSYRALFTIAGGYVTARLAPDRPMGHTLVLAGIGLLAGLAGVVGYYTLGGQQLGPAWYPISLAVEAIPCVLLGATLATRGRQDIPR